MSHVDLPFDSVLDAAVALYQNEIDEDTFVSAVVALPIVPQTPMPESIRRGLNDNWVLKDGPLRQLREVLSARLISASTYNRTLDAAADAGHSA